MNIIKLDAIDSTNAYLKKLSEHKSIENFTVVTANHQTNGRGQLGTSWISEKGKNLTFSILIGFETFKISNQFYLSMAISLAVMYSVKKLVKVPVSIKWPNDILAEKDKIAGILIENSLNGHLVKKSIIGIGLNVNQKIFSKSIQNANSLSNLTGNEFNRDDLLQEILKSIEYFVHFIFNKEFKKLKKMYIASLYKYHKPTMFQDTNKNVFLGKIVDVSNEGKLIIALEDETTRKYNLKEIQFASHNR
jgi:BirA family biotin operon repressor/biotin-[acetyl-CoA-carboxylase] ligase